MTKLIVMKIVKGNFSENVDQKNKILKQQQETNSDNENSRYPDMVINLVKPYISEQPDYDEVAYLIQLCIVACNMATVKNYKLPNFKKTFDGSMRDLDIKGTDITIVKEIMEEKQKKYPDFLNIIEDFDLEDINDESLNVTIYSRTFSDFLEDKSYDDQEDIRDLKDLENMEDMDDMDDFDLGLSTDGIGFVNRSAITLKPTEAFFEWLIKVEPDFYGAPAELEDSVYLIAVIDTKRDFQKWIKKNFEKIFNEELDAWLEEGQSPQKLTYKLFTDFFTVSFCSTITDLEENALRKF